MNQITEIEERMAHLLRAVEDLSDTVARQQRELAQLDRRVALLIEREAAREAETGGVAIADRPPPHW